MMMMEKKNQSYSRLNPRRDSISYLLLKITRQVKTRNTFEFEKTERKTVC